MAEERNVGLARAPEPDDDDLTKEDLQRRMEEARENITQTVSEIKETVVNQYQQVRESISETLDWREQYRRRPLPFSLGAAGVGLLLGYTIAGALFGGDGEDDFEEDSLETDSGILSAAPRSYAGQAIVGRAVAATPTAGAYGVSGHAASPDADSGLLSQPRSVSSYGGSETGASGTSGDSGLNEPASRPSYSSGYESSATSNATDTQDEEPKGPGLLDRFKETKAYDRLQSELSTLGDRVVDELSRTAQTVVLPAVLAKLKDYIGIDLSSQRQVAQRSHLEQQAASASSAGASGSTSTGGGAGSQGSGQGAASAATNF